MWHFVIGLTNFCLLQMPPRDLYMSTILSVENGQSLDLHGVLYTPSSQFQDPNFPTESKQLDFYFFLNAQLVAMALLERPTDITGMFHKAQETCFDVYNALTYVYPNLHVIYIGNFQSFRFSSQQFHVHINSQQLYVNMDIGPYSTRGGLHFLVEL